MFDIFRSYSFSNYHADFIPNALTARMCPDVHCELVCFENDPSSTGNVRLGSVRLGVVGHGLVLEPGDMIGWMPITNLNVVWHKEENTTTYLRYHIIGHLPENVYAHLLQEDRNHLLLEDGGRIALF